MSSATSQEYGARPPFPQRRLRRMRKARFPNQAASAIAASAITQLVSPAFARAAAKASPAKAAARKRKRTPSGGNAAQVSCKDADTIVVANRGAELNWQSTGLQNRGFITDEPMVPP